MENNKMPILLIFFIIVPIIEIALFIQAGDIIGLWWTLATVIITAIIGTNLVKRQGMNAWLRAQKAMNENSLPIEEVFTGICLLLSGALLLTPGFLTDAIGFALLIPKFRQNIGATILNLLKKHGNSKIYKNNTYGGFYQENSSDQSTAKNIIDVEYKIIDDDTNDIENNDKK